MKKGPTLSTEDLAQVGQHWAEHAGDFSGLRHWTEIPEVKARINRKVTGDASTDLFGYVIRKYFQSGGRQLEHCLSLGSGGGELERGLSQYVVPKSHLGIEISAELVRLASERSAEFPHIRYRQADLNTCELEPAQYDLVIAHQSLHHVLNLEGLFDRIRQTMKPNAVFIFDEYVGPRRFQWSDRQLQCINAAIELLPSRLNKDVQTGKLRERVTRCTSKQVADVDPSEAIRSDEIIPLAMRNFRVMEHRPYGGTILHMLMHMTAGNFLTAEARPWLELLFDLEDLLLPELDSDFATMICLLPDAAG